MRGTRRPLSSFLRGGPEHSCHGVSSERINNRTDICDEGSFPFRWPVQSFADRGRVYRGLQAGGGQATRGPSLTGASTSASLKRQYFPRRSPVFDREFAFAPACRSECGRACGIISEVQQTAALGGLRGTKGVI